MLADQVVASGRFGAVQVWDGFRRTAYTTIGNELMPETLVPTMMESRLNWVSVRAMIKDIMTRKDTEDRAKQNQPQARAHGYWFI
ncbi:hypothetical protein QE152_g33416 [Popillia japonica]|uniref:Uncharacterized protein n=1 Tax=Popillia japonica TaxID=7064 RepID=A0AAW1IXG0_POPJA